LLLMERGRCSRAVRSRGARVISKGDSTATLAVRETTIRVTSKCQSTATLAARETRVTRPQDSHQA